MAFVIKKAHQGRRVAVKWVGIIFLFLSWACAPAPRDLTFPESSSSSSISNECSQQIIPGQYLVKWKDGTIQSIQATNDQEFIDSVLDPHIDEIEKVEYNKKIQLLPAAPSDFNVQSSPSITWGQTMSQVASAWSEGYEGQGIKVAIIDTTMDINHTALSPNLMINSAELNGSAGVDDDANGLNDDVYGWNFFTNTPLTLSTTPHEHGTHVGGIVGGASQTGPTWSGIAPQASLLPVSFMSNDGEGSAESAINSIRYAKSRQVQIINASWGGPICSELLRDEIASLEQSNILFVAASGNDGLDLDRNPQYPAAFSLPSLISIAAIQPSGVLASFSNTSYTYVHLVAPGSSIWSTLPGNQYGSMSGTSMAAPFVSGAAAVLLSARPNATLNQLRSALLTGIDSGSYRVQTSGRLNVYKALQAIKNAVP